MISGTFLIIFLPIVGFAAFMIVVCYYGNCYVSGMVDGIWNRRLGRGPTLSSGEAVYEWAFRRQRQEAEETERNLREYERLRREGKLHSQTRHFDI